MQEVQYKNIYLPFKVLSPQLPLGDIQFQL